MRKRESERKSGAKGEIEGKKRVMKRTDGGWQGTRGGGGVLIAEGRSDGCDGSTSQDRNINDKECL